MNEPRDKLLELASALAEVERRQQTCPIAYYEPHTGQLQVERSLAPVTLVLAGNRFGKTHSLVTELMAHAIGYRPWRVPGLKLSLGRDDKWQFPSRRDVPPSAYVRNWAGLPVNLPAKLICVSGLALARGIGEIIQGKWASLWPKQVVFKPYLGPLGAWQKIVLPNESEVYFGSASQEQLAFEGFAADAAFFDEPLPKRIYTAVKRGLIDRKGRLIWTMTPLGDANVAWVAADLANEENTDVEIIRGASGANPHIDKVALQKFFNDPSLSAEERRAREYGEIAILGRRIVTTFDAATAVVPSSTLPIQPGAPVVCVVDPHHSRRPFVIWAQTPDNGESWLVFREWPDLSQGPYEKLGPAKITLHDLAGLIKTMEGRENVVARVCDPAFGRQKAKVLGTQHASFVDQIAEYGLFFETRADNDIERGIQRLRDAFTVDPVVNRPRLLISDNCKNVIRALNFWSYEQNSEGELKVSERYKDPVDVLRYLLGWRYPAHGDGYSYLEED